VIRHRRRAFSLVELLTVIGIIAILLALLMPALSSARRNAQTVQCASNLRQLTAAMISYATEFRGKFPPNTAPLGMFWYNADEIGRHVRAPIMLADQTLGGGVFVCPGDWEGAVRSYAMNVWASSVVSQPVIDSTQADPPRGKLFSMGVGESSHIILLAEAFSAFDAPENLDPKIGFMPHAVIGWVPQEAGRRFGSTPMGIDEGRFGPCDCQVCYFRHRTKADAGLLSTTARGRTNFGFADGHVELLSHADLYDPATGKSTYRALWSPANRETE
jgi:prepilin-type N-terminal cleavage/methylation domain-containing protein/prepilin-type processing-associated H-X9-DG protein